MQFTYFSILALTAPHFIMAAVIPQLDAGDIDILPRAAAPNDNPNGKPISVRSARFARPLDSPPPYPITQKRDAAPKLDVRFAANPPIAAMHFAGLDDIKPHVMARNAEFFDLMQPRDYSPMYKAH